jgi:hypothetical protein
MALQRWGQTDMNLLLQEMEVWSRGSPLEQRAAAAALCEPGLLKDPDEARRVLQVLDGITVSIDAAEDRTSEQFKALRKGLGYCWSVAVAAEPQEGKRMMEQWFTSDDPDVLWIMKQNLGKKRLERMDAAWVQESMAKMGMR